MRNLTLRQIKIFLSASKHMSFTRAANELHISAPAISMQIKEMEDDMGVILFVRENKKVSLTTAGEYFLVYARRVASTLIEASNMMERLRGTEVRALRIGVVSTAKYFLPEMLLEFKKDYPSLQIKVDVRNRQQLTELLRDGELDIAIMGQPPRELDARVEAFANHPHGFIASPNNSLAGNVEIVPDALNNHEVISREPGSGTRALMEDYFSKHCIYPIISMEMSSNETIKQAVIAGLGISFVSLHIVGNELANRQLIVLDVQDTPVNRIWHVVALAKRNAPQAAEAFRYFMLEKGAAILDKAFSYC
jgi:LysR family transcriptional regulator, low CO2-responsive transcriptional regulator